MKTPLPSLAPIQCAGVICFRGDEVLLIKRGTPPRAGDWSIPGGRIEPGETEEDAALRELKEETGITAKLYGKVAMVPAHFEGKNYHLHDYAALWVAGQPVAGDDAACAKFIPVNDIHTLGMWPKTCSVILDAYALCK